MIAYVNADLFKQDSVSKALTLTFSDGDIVSMSELELEQFTVKESICTDATLNFGACNANQVTFPIRNIYRPKTGKTFTIDMVLNGDTANPFRIGTYKVQEDIPTADRTKRQITAFCALYDIINADLKDWYQTLFPTSGTTMTLLAFRNALASHFGLTQVSQNLANDSMVIHKTIDPSAGALSGKDVLFAIGQINGAFPHITRDNKLKYIVLEEISEGLYPAETLYPSDTLFPEDPSGALIAKSLYIPPLDYKDFTTATITYVQIRKDDGDIGGYAGTQGNNYVVENNFLCYGLSGSALNTAASNLLGVISKANYIPIKSVRAKGNPCLEVGDAIRMSTSSASINSYILDRTMTGIQALFDTYSSNGEQYRSEKVNSIATKFEQLRNKTLRIKADVDGVAVELEEQLDATHYGSYAYMTQQQIALKVDETDITGNYLVSKINLTSTTATISASRIKLEGYTTINDGFAVDVNGNVTMKDAVIKSADGTKSVTINNGGLSISESGSFNGAALSIGGLNYRNLNHVVSPITVDYSGNVPYVNGSFNSVSGTSGIFQSLSISGQPVLTASNVGSYAIVSGSASGIEVQTGTGLALNAPNYSGWVHVGYSSQSVSIGASSTAVRIKNHEVDYKTVTIDGTTYHLLGY